MMIVSLKLGIVLWDYKVIYKVPLGSYGGLFYRLTRNERHTAPFDNSRNITLCYPGGTMEP